MIVKESGCGLPLAGFSLEYSQNKGFTMELTITWRFVVAIDISKLYLDGYLLDRKTALGWDLQVDNTDQ